jgi:hypothetical protein
MYFFSPISMAQEPMQSTQASGPTSPRPSRSFVSLVTRTRIVASQLVRERAATLHWMRRGGDRRGRDELVAGRRPPRIPGSRLPASRPSGRSRAPRPSDRSRAPRRPPGAPALEPGCPLVTWYAKLVSVLI